MASKFKILLAAAFGLASLATAEPQYSFVFPTAPLFTSVSGVVYPGPGGAAAVNASALLSSKNATQLTFVNSVPVEGGSYGIVANLSHTTKTFGISAGYVGSVATGTTQHGYQAGMAAKVAFFSVGAGASMTPGATGSPAVNAGATLPMLGEMAFTVLAKNCLGSPQPSFGLGVNVTGFQFEFFLDLPPLDDPDGGNSIGMATSFALGQVSLHGAARQQMLTKTVSYTAGLGVRLNDRIHVSFQYDDLKRVNAGFSLSL